MTGAPAVESGTSAQPARAGGGAPLPRNLTADPKRLHERMLRSLRRLSGPLRTLPDFLIIGAQKAGTTSLYDYLTQHPRVKPASVKEVLFFDWGFRRGLNRYRSHFPLSAARVLGRALGRPFLTGEASPYYIFHPLAPERVFRVLPTVRLIALLRNPVDRAYSQYQHSRRLGREPLASFEEALAAEPERLAGEEEIIRAAPRYRSARHKHGSYLARGIYVDQLKAWDRFFPRQQMLVLRSEDLVDQPAALYARVLSFLGLPSWRPPRFEVRNGGAYPRMDPATRARLAAYFKPHNERLYRYLGRDLGWEG